VHKSWLAAVIAGGFIAGINVEQLDSDAEVLIL
jgi:hypothetical protein